MEAERSAKRKQRKLKRRAKRWMLTDTVHQSCTAITARRMLHACLRARRDLEKNNVGGASWRNGWFAAIALLRGIEHALAKDDIGRSIYLAPAVDAAWDRWKADLHSSQIFFGFIDDERNMLLKEYKFVNHRKIYPFTMEDDFSGSHEILIAGQVVNPSEVLEIAWNWLRGEIKRIEVEADEMRRVAEQEPASQRGFRGQD